jgi:hypothetical protein
VRRPYRVLYLDEEMGRWQLERRVWQLMRGAGIGGDVPLYLTPDALFRATSTDAANRVLSALPDGADPEVIVIDTMRATMLGDENASWPVTQYFDFLQPFWDHGRRTLVVVHHMKKPPDGAEGPRSDPKHWARGSGRITDHVDVAMALHRPEGHPVTRVVVTKGRAAKTPAAWPLSMLLTTTPGEAEFSIVSSALNPPKEPGCPVDVGTATIGTSVSTPSRPASEASRPATTTRQSTSSGSASPGSPARNRLPPTSSTRSTAVPVTRAAKAASAANRPDSIA